jgi:hypothetical protein
MTVNQTFSIENLRLWLNKARNFGVTEKDALELVRAAFAVAKHETGKYRG